MEHIKHLSLGWLVGAAARKAGRASLRGIVGGAMMAAALLFAGCSGEDNLAGEPTTTEPTAQTQATVIRVTVGAGITDPTPDPSPTREGSSADDGAAAPLPSRGGAGVGSVTHSAGSSATTRSTVDVTTDGETGKKTRTLQFSAGDKLYVWRELAGDVTKHLAGELTMKDGSPTDGGTQASFEGELTVYDGTGAPSSYDFQGGNPLAGATATLLHAGMKETDAEGGDYSIDGATRALTFADATGVAATVEALMTKGLVVSGLYDAENDRFPLSATQPIVNCTIAGLTAGIKYKVDYIYGATAAMDGGTKTLAASMTATGGTLAFAFIAETGDMFHGIRLTNTAEATDTYDATIGQKAFESKVYNLSRRFVNLASVTTETDGNGKLYFAAKNGQILTGNPSGKYDYVSIPDGATVTLNGVTFINVSIHCNGAATINLEGTNTIDSEWDFGILIEGGTLTIQGSGSLSATGRDGAAGIGGYDRANLVIKSGNITAQGGFTSAGIGSFPGGKFGTITIEGGTVVATGGEGGAGIGSGQDGGSCGDITITGGKVTATGGDNAAGIGSGQDGGSCGDITISGTANVTATSGDNAPGIGSGRNGSCGDITITGGNVTATGGDNAAGIGSGEDDSSCGNITISGTAYVTATGGSDAAGIGSGEGISSCGNISISGTAYVTATGGSDAAGIGSGEGISSCGAIVIGSDITKVVATKGDTSSAHIGAGSGGSCGTVTIDGVAGATTSSTFPHLTSTVIGKTWTLTNPSN